MWQYKFNLHSALSAQKLLSVTMCEGSLRLEWICEVWVRWELNCTACLCQFVKSLAVQQGAKWRLTAVGLWVQTQAQSGVPVLSKPVGAAVNLHLPLVTAHCCWSVGSSPCKNFSSWHLTWLLSNLSSVFCCQLPTVYCPTVTQICCQWWVARTGQDEGLKGIFLNWVYQTVPSCWEVKCQIESLACFVSEIIQIHDPQSWFQCFVFVYEGYCIFVILSQIHTSIFFIACPIQGRSPAYCRDSAQRQRTIYARNRSYNLFRIISYTNKNVLGLWRKPCMHRQTAHTKMPQRAGRFESRPFLLWGNDVVQPPVQIFSRKKDAVAETNIWVSWVVQ